MTDHSNEGLVHMSYDCDELGVVLDCWFEYEPAERGSREPMSGLQLEPDYPETLTLLHAYTPDGLDISPVMRFELITEIEKEAADDLERSRENDKRDAGYEAYERWLDEQRDRGY